MPRWTVTDDDVDKTLEEMRERAAAFAPVEGRAARRTTTTCRSKLNGTPEGGGEPLQADSVLCHIGAEETMEPFNENLRGAQSGDHKTFRSSPTPPTIPITKLAGKTFHYNVEVLGIKDKEAT